MYNFSTYALYRRCNFFGLSWIYISIFYSSAQLSFNNWYTTQKTHFITRCLVFWSDFSCDEMAITSDNGCFRGRYVVRNSISICVWFCSGNAILPRVLSDALDNLGNHRARSRKLVFFEVFGKNSYLLCDIQVPFIIFHNLKNEKYFSNYHKYKNIVNKIFYMYM